MSQVIDAVFSDGKFKPVNDQRLPLAEGQRVRLIVETPLTSDKDLVELAGEVYEGLSEDIKFMKLKPSPRTGTLSSTTDLVRDSAARPD